MDGHVYSLAHLHPHRLTLRFAARADYPARDVEIRIGYSSHPFTKRCSEGEPLHAIYSKRHDPRVFCLKRYEFRNYFIVDTFDLLPPNTEYWVFFNPTKAEPDALRLFVESAYAGDPSKSPQGRRRESVMFRALVNKTLGLKKANPA